MSRILYIAEGEIEERFIKFLVQNDFIQAGRFRKFNLLQERKLITTAERRFFSYDGDNFKKYVLKYEK